MTTGASDGFVRTVAKLSSAVLAGVRLTVLVLEQLNWNPAAPPPNWHQVRDRWQIAHAARTAVLVLNLVVLYVPPRRRAGVGEG